MIKISTRGHYSLRAVVEMAQIGGNRPVAVAELSKRQDISYRYLEKLFSRLKNANIVESARGIKGGYRLSRPANQITVGQVLKAAEGPLELSRCVTNELESKPCTRQDNCPSRLLWEKVQKSINEVLNNITLEDLISGKEINPQVLQKAV